MLNLEKKVVGIIGYSRTGKAVAKFVSRKGAVVKISDSNASRKLEAELNQHSYFYEIGKNSFTFLKDSDLVVVSPGVPSDAPVIRRLREERIPILSEIELASYFTASKIIGITGSNGKSTVTSLIYDILTFANKKCTLCGNIGFPFIDYVEENVDYHVVELSNFQLENTYNFKPYISILLNITPDHLNRYKDFNEYAEAKFKIFANQTKNEHAILNYDDEFISRNVYRINSSKLFFSCNKDAAQIRMKNSSIFFNNEYILDVENIPLIGTHNIENTMAAIGVAKLLDINNQDIVNSIKSFKGLEHRMEFIDEIQGVKFINDSKATNVDAAYRAIESISEPLIVILGGRDKRGDFTVLNKVLKKKAKGVVLIGEAVEKIRSQLDSDINIFESPSLKEAIRMGYDMAGAGDTIILTPACASFDMYKNFEERGKDFKMAVKNLKDENYRVK